MTRILITTVLILVSLFANAQEKSKNNTISITVNNNKLPKGTIYFALYNKEGFLPKKAIARKNVKVNGNKIKILFKNILNGNYAVLCFLDENDNKRMDFNPNTGIPTEFYGISNNPTLFGPPNFESAKFEVKNKQVNLEIELQ